MSALDCAESRRRSMTAGAAAPGIADRARELLRALRAWHDARTAARHLRTLNDELLKDIGMDRGQIEFLVRGRAAPWPRHAEH